MHVPRRWPRIDLPLRSGDVLLTVPGLLIAGVFALLAGNDGGVREVDWYPAAVFVILLLTVVVAGSGRALALLPRSARIAIALFGAFVVWSFVSIVWADDRGVAWDAADMTLLYFATFALFAVWPWSPRAAMIVLGAFGVALAAIGWSELSQAAGAFDPTAYLIKQRFSEPVGYPNGNAALFLGAMFPIVLLAARRETPWAARGLLLGSAGVLVDVALLSQSRGSLLAGAVLLAVCVAVAPGRVRVLVALATLGAVTLLSVPELLHVYDVASAGGDLGQALNAAGDAATLSFVALFGLGASAGLVERYAELPERTVERVGQVVAALAIAAALAAVVVGIAKIGNPVSYAQGRWDAFKDSKPLTDRTPGTRLTASLDGRSRDEFWSVALREFERRPVGGMGAGNFAVAYSRHRKGLEEPVDPHSLPVRVISQTGIVGAALFLGFLAAAMAALWRVRRHPDVLRRAVAAAAFVGFAYWFVHSAADWLFAIPAVAGPAFAWLGMAVALGAAPHPGVEGRARGRGARARHDGAREDAAPHVPPPRSPLTAREDRPAVCLHDRDARRDRPAVAGRERGRRGGRDVAHGPAGGLRPAVARPRPEPARRQRRPAGGRHRQPARPAHACPSRLRTSRAARTEQLVWPPAARHRGGTRGTPSRGAGPTGAGGGAQSVGGNHAPRVEGGASQSSSCAGRDPNHAD